LNSLIFPFFFSFSTLFHLTTPSASWKHQQQQQLCIDFCCLSLRFSRLRLFLSGLWQANLLMVRKISKLNEKMIKAIQPTASSSLCFYGACPVYEMEL
jgi:hypothetical protein